MVTWYALGLGLLAFAAIVVGAVGVMTLFGAAMSDSPYEGTAASKSGYITIIVAIIVFALAIYGLRHV